jgi:hypothetical protein
MTNKTKAASPCLRHGENVKQAKGEQMDKMDRILRAYQTIIDELKSGQFTRTELEFIRQFAVRITTATDKLLGPAEPVVPADADSTCEDCGEPKHLCHCYIPRDLEPHLLRG